MKPSRRGAMRTTCSVLLKIATVLGCIHAASIAQEYDIRAKIESVRKDRFITLRFRDRAAGETYAIVSDGRVIGSVEVLDIKALGAGPSAYYRGSGYYRLENPADGILIRAGLEIGLRRPEEKREREFGEHKRTVIPEYKKAIKTPRDRREMVLVPEGKFLFGSGRGDRDEAPEKIVDVPAFYIDKYEVSNHEYMDYVNEMSAIPPQSWTDGMYGDGEEDFPVIVTYYEAEAYAKWAGKRLPTEAEWEKAARGVGFESADTVSEPVRNPFIYPWGGAFGSGRANSMEFWNDAGAGAAIKKNHTRGLLPVAYFEGKGDSPFGAVNMSGNAMEWTSSWYRAYPGNTHKDRRYGTQFKVLRGGSWRDTAKSLRVTDRQIGGIPNLYKDAIGGIRCVKSPTVLDLGNEGN